VTKSAVARTLEEMADWIRNLRDAGDVLRRAKNPAELAKALVPNAWLARRVLNLDAPRAAGPVPAAEAAEALKKLGNALKVEVIGDDGQVDYAKLQTSDRFAELERTSSLLHQVDPLQLTNDDARIAFWINVYNVLAIHGVIATGVRESVMEIPSFFGVVAYSVGDFVVTLDEIENGILRRNAPHPASKSRLFDDDDPRLALCPDHVDPRIHAALVCASTSCPPVAFYEASRLDEQLDLAADNYVSADVEIDDEAQVIRLPITFRYYESDFGRQAGVELFLLKHAAGPQRQALRGAFDAKYAFDYHRYDWSLNAMA